MYSRNSFELYTHIYICLCVFVYMLECIANWAKPKPVSVQGLIVSFDDNGVNNYINMSFDKNRNHGNFLLYY